MTRRTLTLVGAPLALTLLLAACGGSSGTTAPAGGGTGAPNSATEAPAATGAGGGTSGGAQATAAGDAGGAGGGAAITCATLLSDAEAQAILGTKPEPVDDQSFPGTAYCSWDIGDGFALTIKVSIDPTSVGIWRGEKDSVPTAADGKETAAPGGLGDEVYAFDALADTYWIFVRRGDKTMRVSAPASALPDQTVRDLVEKLYSRF